MCYRILSETTIAQNLQRQFRSRIIEINLVENEIQKEQSRHTKASSDTDS